MEIFVKSTVGTIVATILYLVLAKQGKDVSVLLTVAVCGMLAAAAIICLEPVLDFIDRLRTISDLDTQMFRIVLRSAGIGLLAEITALICSDAGNSAMGKTLQMLGGCVILLLSLPIMTKLLDLLQTILGSI